MELFEDALKEFGDVTYHWVKLDELKKKKAVLNEAGSYIRLADFPFRALDDVRKVAGLFDVIPQVAEPIDVDQMCDRIIQLQQDEKNTNTKWWNAAGIPQSLRPASELPNNSYMQVFFVQADAAPLAIVKYISLGETTATAQAKQFCVGEAKGMHWKPNPWGVKKAYQMLLERMEGTHLVHAKVVKADAKEDSQKKGWHPTKDEIHKGFAYLNRNCPPGYEPNEILQWIVEQIKDQESPLYEWPMGLVEKATNNLTRRIESADAEFFFPLVATNEQDFKSVLVKKVLPLVIAFTGLSGLFVTGVPGIGKTPWCCGIAMMFGRLQVRLKQLRRKAGWRRGKQFDVFRGKPGEVQEAVLLDDPDLLAMQILDLLSFGDLAYQGHSDCRYSPPKWEKNQWRAIMSNQWSRENEPEAMSGITIPHESFMNMLQKCLGHLTVDHKLAFLKRYITVVVGQNAVYVRPPSEDPSTKIFRITDDNLHKDFLVAPGNKGFFGAWKKGDDKEYPNFAEAIDREQAMVDEIRTATADLTTDKEIIEWWLTKVGLEEPRGLHVLPATPLSQSTEVVPYDSDGHYTIPLTRVSSRQGHHTGLRQASGSTSSSVVSGAAAGSIDIRDDQGEPGATEGDVNVKLEPPSPENSWWSSANAELARMGVITVGDSPAKRSRTGSAHGDVGTAHSVFCGDANDESELQSILHSLSRHIDGHTFVVESEDEDESPSRICQAMAEETTMLSLQEPPEHRDFSQQFASDLDETLAADDFEAIAAAGLPVSSAANSDHCQDDSSDMSNPFNHSNDLDHA